MKKTTVDKWKKKLWFTIYAPKEFDLKEMGETVATKAESVPGRTINVSARELLNQMRKHYIKIKFRIIKVEGTKAYTETLGHEINEGYLRKFTRRRSSKIELVVKGKSKDNLDVKIKAVAISVRKADTNKRRDIRNAVKEEVKTFIAATNSDMLISTIVSEKPAKMVLEKIKKICPVKRVEITKSEIKKPKQTQ